MKKHVLKGEDARNSLLEGVNATADIVGSTMGASGRTIFISHGYGTIPTVTKDGITVAAAMSLENQYANLGAMAMKNAGDKTVIEAGDGTTQTIVLARDMVREAIKHLNSGVQPQYIKKGMEKAVSEVIKRIQETSEEITHDSDKLKSIATISANNDTELGLLIANSYSKIGKNGILNIEHSNTIETYVDVVKGFEFNKGYMSPYFANNEKRQCVLENPIILVVDYDMSTIKDCIGILKPMSEAGRPIVIIAKGIEGEVFSTLVANRANNNMPICLIKAPNTYQKELLMDVAVLTGATLISDEIGIKMSSAKMEHLGTCEKIVVSQNSTTIINGKGDLSKIQSRENEINIMINDADENTVKDVHTKRLARLTGSIGVIYVGASSDLEAKEKCDRVDDAVRACKSALEEGISVGGGVALLRCIDSLDNVVCDNQDEKVGVNIIKKSLEAPIRQILKNANASVDYTVMNIKNSDSHSYGYNCKTMSYGDLREMGVIDPSKVIRVALQNANSVACAILVSDGMIVNMIEK